MLGAVFVSAFGMQMYVIQGGQGAEQRHIDGASGLLTPARTGSGTASTGAYVEPFTVDRVEANAASSDNGRTSRRNTSRRPRRNSKANQCMGQEECSAVFDVSDGLR